MSFGLTSRPFTIYVKTEFPKDEIREHLDGWSPEEQNLWVTSSSWRIRSDQIPVRLSSRISCSEPSQLQLRCGSVSRIHLTSGCPLPMSFKDQRSKVFCLWTLWQCPGSCWTLPHKNTVSTLPDALKQPFDHTTPMTRATAVSEGPVINFQLCEDLINSYSTYGSRNRIADIGRLWSLFAVLICCCRWKWVRAVFAWLTLFWCQRLYGTLFSIFVDCRVSYRCHGPLCICIRANIMLGLLGVSSLGMMSTVWMETCWEAVRRVQVCLFFQFDPTFVSSNKPQLTVSSFLQIMILSAALHCVRRCWSFPLLSLMAFDICQVL